MASEEDRKKLLGIIGRVDMRLVQVNRTPPSAEEQAAENKETYSKIAQLEDFMELYDGKLTDWECDFVYDLSRRVEQCSSISEKQREVIDRLYSKYIA